MATAKKASKGAASESRLKNFFSCLEKDLEPHLQNKAALRLSSRMRKRALISNPELPAKAISLFKEMNNYVGARKVSLDADVLRHARNFVHYVLERYTKAIDPDSLQEVICKSEIYDNWRFGPGTSNGVQGTHTVDKISQIMTCTSLAVPLIQRLRFTNSYFKAFDCLNGVSGYTVVDGSRLTTVPKNETTARTIAIEPSGNMCLQLSAGMYLENALRFIGLDIGKQQTLNKRLACRGSIDGTLCTIDLKSASDLIGLDLVKHLFPREWTELFDSLRSPVVTLPGGEVVTLNMISTMGNGFTFPLMTFILTALIYAMRAASGGPINYIDWSKTAVYGDDIIVLVSEYAQLRVILEGAGFIVNDEKSYYSGTFRESCGGDYDSGEMITPFYVTSLTRPSEIYTALNKLLDWSGWNDIFLPASMAYLIGLLDGKVLLVPEWHNPDQGLLTAQVARRYVYLDKKFSRTQFEENNFLLPLAIGGYVESGQGPDFKVFYTTRETRVKDHVRKARLPKGFLDGWDPRKRDSRTSSRISLFVKLMT